MSLTALARLMKSPRNAEATLIFSILLIDVYKRQMEDHTLIRNSDCKLLGVQMDLSVLDTAFSPFYESQYLVPFIRGSGKYQRRIRVPKGSLLESILSEILVEYQKKQPGYEMYIKGDILRLFSCLVRTLSLIHI